MREANKAAGVHLGAEDGVVVVVAKVGARHVAELDHVGAGDERGGRPLGQLVGVVLQLRRQHCSALVLQLLPPVHTCPMPVQPIAWKRSTGCMSSQLYLHASPATG